MIRIIKPSTSKLQRSSRSRLLSCWKLRAAAFSTGNGDEKLLVIGSGVAGSTAALIAAEHYKLPVSMLYAGALPTDCNSYWAQGGIIYQGKEGDDSPDMLAADIHRAGAGLCRDPAVQLVANRGPERVRELLLSGHPFARVPFDRNAETGALSLCLEASHSAPRILHQADHTGRTITQHLAQAVAQHPLIQQHSHTVVTDLIVEDNVCIGVNTLDRTKGITQQMFGTHGTVLCAGGLGGIYQHSTNPPGFNALGSSVALAKRAGVTTQDLEFVQFHPTALYIPNEARFLLSEALRGEGAILRNSTGYAFAKDYHPDGELAPRDVVARAVFEESQRGTVYLDITHRDAAWLHQRFPSIQQHLQQHGLDLAQHKLPITPAAHYTCGGVATDLQGRTNVLNLYAAGEAACTGLHGGNRLASTSLLEGLVFGAAVADHVGSEEARAVAASAAAGISQYKVPNTASPLEPNHIQNAGVAALQLLQRVRSTMWDHVGVARTPGGLERAMDELNDVTGEIGALHSMGPTLETAAVRDAACAGAAVAQAALQNRNSAGAHFITVDGESDTDDDVMVASD